MVIKKGFIVVLFFTLFSTVSAFAQKNDSTNYVSDSLKTKVIKYHITKLTGGDKEIVSKRTEVTISPENINIYSEIEDQVAGFNIVIQSVDWNFNANLTKGFATYKGYIKQASGVTTEEKIVIEANEHANLKISNYDKRKDLIMYVDKWQIIK